MTTYDLPILPKPLAILWLAPVATPALMGIWMLVSLEMPVPEKHWLMRDQPASSCRDDLESLGYMAFYFLRGSLPWQGLRAPNRQEKYRRVLERNQQTGVDELCRYVPP